MTAIIVILALALAADLVATMRTLRHDKPSQPPRSHSAEWSSGLPSHPYTA